MKAVVYSQYGPPNVLRLGEVAKPSPQEGEVLIRVYATTVTSGDTRVRSLKVPPGFRLMFRLIYGFSKPRKPIIGVELSGVIEAVGQNVTRFKPGDQVFAMNGTRMGAYAEYAVLSESGAIAVKPHHLSYGEAAALSFGGTTALSFFRLAKLQKGEKILVIGASGGVGTAAVQLAKHFGAEVTGVCSTSNVELVRSIGADRVIDYTKQDFTENGETYDIIMDTVGKTSFAKCKDSLKAKGRLLLVAAGLPEYVRIPRISLTSNKKVVAGAAAEKSEDLRYMADLAEAGAYKVVIDRTYPLEQIADAHRYVDGGRKKGNVIINLDT